MARTRPADGGPGRLRLAVCVATIAACVPYLTIKIAWLSGSTVGWNDADAAKDSALYVANAVTMGMDAVAVLVVLALTFHWGTRIPAWTVLAPVWIAAGLLAPIALAVPLGAAVQLLTSPEPLTGTDNAIQGWVYGIVYTGFTLQAVGLLTAFVLYARNRWADVFVVQTADVPLGATHPLQVLLARGAAVLAVVYASAHFYWAFGGTAGVPAEQIAKQQAAQQVIDGAWALLALGGAVALLLIVRRSGRPRRFIAPLVVAWCGAGAMFAWSSYLLVIMLGRPEFLDSDTTAATNLTAMAGMLAGIVMGLTGAFLLAERAAQSARPIASSTP